MATVTLTVSGKEVNGGDRKTKQGKVGRSFRENSTERKNKKNEKRQKILMVFKYPKYKDIYTEVLGIS